MRTHLDILANGAWLLALLMLLGATGCIREVTVRRNSAVTFSNGDADAIFNEMSAILGNDDGGSDFACAGEFADVLAATPLSSLDPAVRADVIAAIEARGVTPNTRPVPLVFLRSGTVGTATGVARIMNQADFAAVDAGPGFAKVVTGIFWCGRTLMTSALGCTFTGGLDTIVVIDRPSNTDAAITWAHEYGHAVGLPDLPADGDNTNIMFPTFRRTLRRINLLDCAFFTTLIDIDGPGGIPAPQLPEPGMERPSGMAIEDFVRQTPAHGLAYSVKDSVRPDDVPRLLRMLGREREAEHRDKILALLGLAGDAEVGDVIAAHVERLRRTRVQPARLNELTSAMLGLGALANHRGSDRAARALRGWAEASAWKVSDRGVAHAIQRAAMMGLALSGSEWATGELTEMAGDSRDSAGSRSAAQMLSLAERVARDGLADAMNGAL